MIDLNFTDISDSDIALLGTSAETRGPAWAWLADAAETALSGTKIAQLDSDELDRPALSGWLRIAVHMRDSMAGAGKAELERLFADLVADLWAEQARRDAQSKALEGMALLDDFGAPDDEWTATPTL